MSKQPQLVLADHASQGGNWYTIDGRQVELVPGADGDMVKPDIRHARKMHLLPGVTSQTRLLDKPPLTDWKIKKALECAWKTIPVAAGTDMEAWIKQVREEAEKLSMRDEGTAIHAAIQEHFTLFPRTDAAMVGSDQTTLGVVTEIAKLDPGPWTTEKVHVHPLGFGTKCDLSAIGWILDFKSKGTADNPADLESLREERLYKEHEIQLAAVREAVGNFGQRCAIVFVSRTHPGACYVKEVKQDRLERGWSRFQKLHALWCDLNEYDPSFIP